MATPSMFSESHRKVGYSYHNMLMRELPVMTYSFLNCAICQSQKIVSIPFDNDHLTPNLFIKKNLTHNNLSLILSGRGSEFYKKTERR